MKKRLSLLMVLMMIVSLLPMSAFAAAVPGTTVVIANEGDTKAVSVGFVVPGGASISTGQLRFELDNGAEFTAPPTVGTVGGTLVASTGIKINDSSYAANITTGVTNAAANAHQLTFNANVEFNNTGDVNLRVIDNDNTGIGSQTVKVAVVGVKDTSKLAITVNDAEKVMSFDGGKLSQFEIKNIPAGTTQLALEVEKGLSWDMTNTTAVGLGGMSNPGRTLGATKNIMLLNLSNTAGSIVVNPEFEGAGRNVTEGNVTVDVDVTAPATVSGSNRAVIGKIVDYGVTMTIVEDGKKEIPNVWGGEEATVKVTLKGPKGSLLDRPIDFKADGANVKAKLDGSSNLTQTYFTSTKPSGMVISGDTSSTTANAETQFKDKEFTVSKGTAAAFDTLEEVSFTVVIKTAGDKDGVATLTAAQRGWEVKADLAKVTPKFAAKADVTPVKKGEARDTATVTLTEAKAGLLTKKDTITLSFDTKRDYVDFTTKSLKVEATNGMQFGDIAWTNSGDETSISIPITRTSAGEPAVITITGLNVAVDGSTTDDVVQLAAGINSADVSVIDYVKVVKEYDLESILSVFTIGQTAYTVNGETKAAHSAPYIKAGRTMLPIRAVAESLGLTVQWNSATRTASFTDASKVAAVTIGAKVMYVNGTPMPLTVPAELVNDTTFVELRSLATAFGVQIDWDAAAKTATVSK